LFRLETQDGVWPYEPNNPVEHPRVCRIYDLLEQGKPRLINEIKDFNLGVGDADGPRDGKYFAVDGWAGDFKSRSRKLKAFDGLTGQEIFSMPPAWERASGRGVEVDPTGRYLTTTINETPMDEDMRLQVEMPAGKILGAPTNPPKARHPESRYWFGPNDVFPEALTLVRRGDERVLVSLRIDSKADGSQQFNADETLLAWGSAEGLVFVCDLAEVQRRLESLRLGW
jgi:hypothetical protein